MISVKPSDRLKARMFSAAVEENLDVIHDRLPQRPSPRSRVLPAMGRLVLAAVVILTSADLTRTPSAAPAVPGKPARPVAAARATVPPAPVLDASLLSQPISPGVLDLTVRRVVIDAGHGGTNPGTSSLSGLKEKDLTIEIAGQVQQLLAARGFETVMTRTGDDTLSLQQRAATANGGRGDIFVSIHLNWLERSDDGGIETFYLGPSRGGEPDAIAAVENQQSGYSLADMRTLLERIYTDARRDESRRLATLVQESLLATLRKSEPAVSDRGVKMAPFVVLSATDMPAILAEVSCLSNRAQAEYLKKADARQKIAEALVSGIQGFARESRAMAAERTEPNGR